MDAKNEFCNGRFSTGKTGKQNSVFIVNNCNTDRPVNSAADNNKSLSKTNFVKRRPENYACPSVFAP